MNTNLFKGQRTNWKLALIKLIIVSLVGGIFSYFIFPEKVIGLSQITENSQRVSSSKEAIVTGRLMYISDVMTIPNHPITEGSIILIPSERFTSFLKEIPMRSDFNEDMLWHLQSGVSQEVAPKYITANSPLDSKGRFSMVVSEGNYVLCFSSPEELLSHQWPIRILGCVRIEAQEGRKLYLDLRSVWGGLRIDRQKSE